MCKKTLVIFMLGFLFLLVSEGYPDEIRGVWITRWDIDEPLKVFELLDKLDKCKNDYHINTLFVQIYARGEAMYNSSFVPRATELFGTPMNYDPLKLILETAHNRGYKVHAWLNLFYVWSQAPFPDSKDHISYKHPDWFIGDYSGNSMKFFSIDKIKALNLEGYFLEPGNVKVRKYLKEVVTEIVKNYNIDGIHMDYCRFPGRDYGYDTPARVTFMRENYVDPLELQNESALKSEYGKYASSDLECRWDDWRREQVTLTVKTLAQAAKALKPNIQVSAAVIGDYKYASGDLFQDWKLWADSGYVDFVVPMLYSSSIGWVEKKSKRIAELVGNNKVAIGLGAYLMDYTNLLQEIIKIDGIRTRGYLLFSYGGMVEKGYFK